MNDGRDVANRILDICDELDISVSNLALQKLLYFCHISSLTHFGKPLVKHQFEAWEYGPVLPYVYHEFKNAGSGPIDYRAEKLNKENGRRVTATAELNEDAEKVLIDSVKFYARLSPSQLVELSHVHGGPWWTAWQHQGEINLGMKISDLDIVSFYSKSH